MWEANNLLTNFDPVTQDDDPRQGRIDCRSRAGRSRSQQLRPAPRLRLHADGARPWSAAAGASATCTSTASARRTCSGSTDRRSCARRSTSRRPPRASCRRKPGYPAGLTDSSKFNPLTALVSYIPRDFHSSPVQSWHVSVQREFGPHMLLDLAYVGNKASDLLIVGELQPGRAEQRRRHDSARGASADSDLGGHHLRLQRRQVALRRVPDEIRVAAGRRREHPQLADAVEGEGQRRRRAGKPERQLPVAAGHQQPRRRLRPVGV